MDREGAETHLRLLAEAVLRGPLAAASWPPYPVGPGPDRDTMVTVAQALTAVGALDTGTAETILADFDLAVNVRQISDRAGAGQYTAVYWPARLLSFAPGPVVRGRRVPGHRPDPAAPGSQEPPSGRADRFVPVGLTVPFRQEGTGGELCLMSFARTGSGARFIAVWGVRTSAVQLRMGLGHPDLIPFELFTVTDDRGTRYDLDFAPGGRPDWASEIRLRPAPPPGVRWLDVAAPLSRPVRVGLDPASAPADAGPQVTGTELSSGEHMLIRLAEQVLTEAQQLPRAPRRLLAAGTPGPAALATGFGDVIAALRAAGAMPPDSQVPARLAALCESIGISGHGIPGRADARELPETWLSLLAHYQRRKPDLTPVRDGYAALAAALPEIDGIRLAAVGLHNSDGCSRLHMLAGGLSADHHPGPFGAALDFPLSVWLRDSGGRWHAARATGWRGTGRECVIQLTLMPPLARSTAWIEMLASGRSAEVRTRLPLRWGYLG